MRSHLILTGAGGYIGRRVAALAIAGGRDVTVLMRNPANAPPGTRGLAWSLGEDLPDGAIRADIPFDRQAVIHLAHDWTNRAEDQPRGQSEGQSEGQPGGQSAGPATEGGLNVNGTRTLTRSCHAAGLARFVFVSSQSAREDAANIYGRVKWRAEQGLDTRTDAAARVGLVYGGQLTAMYGLLCRLTELVPVLPMIDPWRPVQPIHLDEVCDGLLRLADSDATGWFGLAAPQGMGFGDFLKGLARGLHGKNLPIIPVPLKLALLGCDISAKIPFGPTVDRERVLGLAGTRPMECEAHLRMLGLELAPFAARLCDEPASRKAVLREGRVLLRFVLRGAPGSALLRRYARAVARSGRPGPIRLPGLARRMPRLLRIFEPLGRTSALSQRLNLAMSLAEASPEGQVALHRGGWLRRLASLVVDGAIDVLVLPARLIAGRRRD